MAGSRLSPNCHVSKDSHPGSHPAASAPLQADRSHFLISCPSMMQTQLTLGRGEGRGRRRHLPTYTNSLWAFLAPSSHLFERSLVVTPCLQMAQDDESSVNQQLYCWSPWLWFPRSPHLPGGGRAPPPGPRAAHQGLAFPPALPAGYWHHISEPHLRSSSLQIPPNLSGNFGPDNGAGGKGRRARAAAAPLPGSRPG